MYAAVGTRPQEGLIMLQGEPAAEQALQGLLKEVSRRVLEPILGALAEAGHEPPQKWFISPDATLWMIPWGALLLPDGRYALERYEICYLGSSRDLVSVGPEGEPARSAAVFADPDFDLDPAEVGAASPAAPGGAGAEPRRAAPWAAPSGIRAFRLPGTAVEAKIVIPRLQEYCHAEPDIYLDRNAREGTAKELHRPRVLVMSTHGFFLPDQVVQTVDPLSPPADTRSALLTTDGKPLENPLLRCGLLLAGCNQCEKAQAAGTEDGIYTGLEIVGTDLHGTELVVLSACDTGVGDLRIGEGVAGLRQAFQLAGARAVVATLWRVPDRQSATLMGDFFANLAAGQSKPTALRNAQLAMIQSRREKYTAAHPFFWAAFTLTGR
jgi:CHAT domain-containing protein